MSAVCWTFGRELLEARRVPIGLINTNWGGSWIEDWSSPTKPLGADAETLALTSA